MTFSLAHFLHHIVREISHTGYFTYNGNRAQRIQFWPGGSSSDKGRIHSRRPNLFFSFFTGNKAADHTFRMARDTGSIRKQCNIRIQKPIHRCAIAHLSGQRCRCLATADHAVSTWLDTCPYPPPVVALRRWSPYGDGTSTDKHLNVLGSSLAPRGLFCL